MFQEKNTNTLCHSIVKLAESHSPSLITETKALCEKFKKLFSLFALCHGIYDQNYVKDDKIKDLGNSNYIDYYGQICTAIVLYR